MRLKQQTFVDKYIEKVILGIAALIGIGIIFFFVIGTPYSIDIKGQNAAPDEVEKSYLGQANLLKEHIGRSEPPKELVDLVIPDYVSRFDARYEQPPVHSDAFYGIVFGPPGVTGVGGTKPPGSDRLVVVVPPPAPTEVAAVTSNHVLEPDQTLFAYYSEKAHDQYPDAKPEEVKRIATEWARAAVAKAGQRSPRDFHTISISGTISPQAWLDALTAAAKADPDKAMSDSWYSEILQFISGIEVRRQTMGPDGQWPKETEFEPVQVLPGAVAVILADYVKQVQDAKTGAKKVDEDEASQLQQSLVENLRLSIEDLAKPQFLPVKAHRPWTQPEQAIPQLSPEDQQAIFRLNQQIARVESDLRTILRSTSGGVDAQGRPILPRVNPNDPYGLEDPRGPGAKGPKTPPKASPKAAPTPKTKQPLPGDPAAGPKKNANEEKIAFNQAKLADLYKQKDEILAKLYKEETDPTKIDPSRPNIVRPPNPNLRPDPSRPFVRPPQGFDPYRDPRIPGGRRPIDPRIPGGPLDFQEDAKLPSIKFWAHDVTVLPGKSYRYQVVFKVINPLFNKEGDLVNAQKPLASNLELASQPSAWTTPITIEPDVQYFVEDTNPQTNTVKWGIYRIHNGYRIRGQFDTRPGDPIGKAVDIDVKDDTGKSVKELVDLRIPAMLVDVKSPPRQAGALNAKGPTTVLLADMENGAMSTRDPAADKVDAERIRLSNEASGALAAVPTSTDVRPGDPLGPTRGNPLLPPDVRPPPR